MRIPLSWRAVALAAALILPPAAAQAQASMHTEAVDDLRFNQVRMLGSHNSFRPFPSPAAEQRIKAISPKFWPGLEYGHPPLESQLALGLHQFELDVAPDPQGGRYAAPYIGHATPEVEALMRAPGAKTMHVPVMDYEVSCLTFRLCLGIFARWSDTHPGHDPIVILVNSVDWPPRPPMWTENALFDQASIDALNTDIFEVIGRNRVVTPDEVRGSHATLREAVTSKAWPKMSSLRGRFIFVLDGNGAHENFLRAGHPSLKGRAMFGWFDEDQPEAAFFNLQDPVKEFARAKRLVEAGFIVRTRADADVVEARTRDGRRMKAALASGAQLVSSDFYAGVPDPRGFGYVADFEGPMLRCNPITAQCPAGAR
jgi:hypothetical protein